MAYQNISVNNGYELVLQLASFATSVGWTVHVNKDRDGFPTQRWIVISPDGGSPYFSIVGDTSEILFTISRGLNASLDYNNQPDTSYDSSEDGTQPFINLPTTPILGVHFFGNKNPDYIYCCIEITIGHFRHLMMGNLEKFGSSLGGGFIDHATFPASINALGSFSNTKIPFSDGPNSSYYRGAGHIDSQDKSGNPQWYRLGSSSGFSNYNRGGFPVSDWYENYQLTPVQFNGRSIIHTPVIFAEMDNELRVPVGYPANIKFLNMEYYQSGDEIVLGSDTWKIFPIIKKQDAIDGSSYVDEGTFNYGLAILKG